jgi:ABC-type transporter Mla subunit MlaD
MRRIALTLGLLAALAATVVTMAGASDTRTYQAELFNAFGLVKGSELRIAGAKAGQITGLDITPQKTALVTFEVDGGFPELKSDASCSSEPQSLIAEYFLDCQPGTAPDPLNGPIPAAHNKTTVQPDLAQNTLREPFKQRLALLINEFGTALDANGGNLNAAIRSGAPALQQLKQVLNILGDQNTTIADLNTNADAIFAQLAQRRDDVVHFIDNAGRTAAISAERSSDLSKNFDLLDNFLAELQPTAFQLGKLATYQTPLLRDLHAAAPGLNRLATNLPSFNDGAQQSLTALGGAAHVGKTALANSKEEIASLNQASTKAYPAADQVAQFLESADDPRNAVEEDSCARYDLREQPGEADRRVQLLDQKLSGDSTFTALHGDQTAPCKWASSPPGTDPTGGNPGFTGLEGLLNYSYIQTNALNLFDQLGHSLGITLVAAPGLPTKCGYQTGQTRDNAGNVQAGVSSKSGGPTSDPREFAECAGILGDRQPDINYARQPTGLFGNLKPYDGSVCPNNVGAPGSPTNPVPTICQASNVLANSALAAAPKAADQIEPTPQTSQQAEQQKQIQKILGDTPNPGDAPDATQQQLQNLLQQLPTLPQLPDVLPPLQGLNSNSGGSSSGSTTTNLLNFLLGQ